MREEHGWTFAASRDDDHLKHHQLRKWGLPDMRIWADGYEAPPLLPVETANEPLLPGERLDVFTRGPQTVLDVLGYLGYRFDRRNTT